MTTAPQPRVALVKVAHSMTGRLRGYFYRYARNWATTDDLLQDLFLRVLKYTVTDRAAARAYIWRTANSIACDWYRRQTNSLVRYGENYLILELPDEDLSPEQETDMQRALERIEALLPPRCFQAYRLVIIMNYSYEEAASEMNITVDTVKAHLRDAFRELRNLRKKGTL